MTGQDVRDLFLQEYDEVQSGYFDPTRLQSICNTALMNVYQKKVDDFQNRAQTTDELLPYIQTVTVTPGANNTIDISQTSIVVPDYKLLANIEVVFTVNDIVYRNRATQLKTANKNRGTYGQGTLRAPKYVKTDDNLMVLPLDYPCEEAVIDYITNQSAILLTDNSVQVLYTNKFIQLLINAMLVEAAKSNREYTFMQVAKGEQASNP